MTPINKLPASAGAQWLLDAFALLRRAPLRLSQLGLIWGLLTLVALFGSMLHPTLGMSLQLGLSLLGPFLFAGLLWAVREVDAGREAAPAHLLAGLRSGKGTSLLATLLPQLLMGLFVGLAFFALVGAERVQQMFEVAEQIRAAQAAGEQPDPALVADLPVGRVLLCVLLALAAVPVVVFAMFIAVPQVIFSGRDGLPAMRTSFRACLSNLPAMALFLLLLVLTMMVLSVGMNVVAMVLAVLLGEAGAILAANLLLMGVLMPLLAGTAYCGWKQMLGQAGPAAHAAAPSAPASIEL